MERAKRVRRFGCREGFGWGAPGGGDDRRWRRGVAGVDGGGDGSVGGLSEEGGGVGLRERSLRRRERGRRKTVRVQMQEGGDTSGGTYVDEVFKRVSDGDFGLHAVVRRRVTIESAPMIDRPCYLKKVNLEHSSRPLTVMSRS